MTDNAKKSLAELNGETCFRSGLEMDKSNPYKRNSVSHIKFEIGYKRAEKEVAK